MNKAELEQENTELAEEVAAERKKVALLEKQVNNLQIANKTLVVEILKTNTALEYAAKIIMEIKK